MKKKILLLVWCTLATLLAVAQEGGIMGKVVSRAGRQPIEHAKIMLNDTPLVVYSAADGTFRMENVPDGIVKLTVEAPDFITTEVNVRVEGTMKDVNFITMAPESVATVELDDASFADFDMETANDALSMPVTLSASKDVFDNIAGYKFGAMRFRNRGYESSTQDVYMNGVLMNDAVSGYSPWSLWSGLNDATRNQEVTSGIVASDYGVGGINGVTQINARASDLRQGFRTSFVNASGQYRFRVMATYASGLKDNGWAYAFSVSTRQGGNDWVEGVYYNAWSYYASVEKVINPFHRLALTFFGVPTHRGAQAAATQEVYDLVGSNYYNPNWGLQVGDKRNARVRSYHEPVAVLNYEFKPNDRTQLNAVASFRFGENGYSALDWYNSQDPRPDYYRKLPSYFEKLQSTPDPAQGELARQAWIHNLNGTQHLHWDDLFYANRNTSSELNGYLKPDGSWEQIPGTEGLHRSVYIISERHTDQRDLNLKLQLSHVINNNSKINSGLEYRWNRTEYYNEVKDLLGGDYFLNVDNFAERDFSNDLDKIQNNLDAPNQLVGEGDKYNYDYYAHIRNYKLWAVYNYSRGHFQGYAGAEVGYNTFWREGLYRKGLFPNNSKGDSEKQKFFTYTAKLGGTYKISGQHNVSANVVYMQSAPYFQDAFISPRTRNSVVDDLKPEKTFSADLNYAMRFPWMRLRLTGYYTLIKDQTRLISFYDDLQHAFSNFAMSGIDETHYGLELGFQIPFDFVTNGLSLSGAVSYGSYKYSSNPRFTQTVDNSAQVFRNSTVYWKDYHVESTPQTAINLGFNYRSPNYWFAGIDVSYYNDMYLSMNPLFRTDYATAGTTNPEAMVKQEKFPHAFVVNANIGKSWYIQRKYQLGFSLEVKNLLNDQNIKTGGYEQMRLREMKNDNNQVVDLRRFDSKYFYMFGTSYYLNIYFRF